MDLRIVLQYKRAIKQLYGHGIEIVFFNLFRGKNVGKSLCRTGENLVPGSVTMATTISQIAPGNDHTLFLGTNGVVYSCGSSGNIK